MTVDQTAPPDQREQTVSAEVLRALRGLHHGYVQLTVQDARVIQIDTHEKRRFDRV